MRGRVEMVAEQTSQRWFPTSVAERQEGRGERQDEVRGRE
jgi:hypothetical protein